jgi:hypothetical protein
MRGAAGCQHCQHRRVLTVLEPDCPQTQGDTHGPQGFMSSEATKLKRILSHVRHLFRASSRSHLQGLTRAKALCSKSPRQSLRSEMTSPSLLPLNDEPASRDVIPASDGGWSEGAESWAHGDSSVEGFVDWEHDEAWGECAWQGLVDGGGRSEASCEGATGWGHGEAWGDSAGQSPLHGSGHSGGGGENTADWMDDDEPAPSDEVGHGEVWGEGRAVWGPGEDSGEGAACWTAEEERGSLDNAGDGEALGGGAAGWTDDDTLGEGAAGWTHEVGRGEDWGGDVSGWPGDDEQASLGEGEHGRPEKWSTTCGHNNSSNNKPWPFPMRHDDALGTDRVCSFCC